MRASPGHLSPLLALLALSWPLLAVAQRAGRWASLKDLPVALGEVSAGLLTDKNNRAFVVVVGERDDSTLVYDVAANRWRRGATRPFPSGHHVAAEVVNRAGTSRLYLFGGLRRGQDKVQIYNIDRDRWTLGADMPYEVGSAATAFIGGKVYLCGGILQATDDTTDKCARYDPASDSWDERVKPMPRGVNHAAAATDGKLMYVAGGRKGRNRPGPGYNYFQIYNPAANTWRLVKGAPLPQGRGGMGKGVMLGGQLYVIGGESDLQGPLPEIGLTKSRGLCKAAGLPATGKATDLVQRLAKAEADLPPTTARKSRAQEAKTPRTSRKAAAPTPAVDKAALLRAAASTPLPPAQQANGAGDEDQEQRRRSSGGARRRLSATPKAATPKGHTRRAAAPGVTGPVFWLLLLTAAAAALAALGVPYCQQRDCHELARNLPELAVEAGTSAAAAARGHAQVAYAAARARALAAADLVQERWQQLKPQLAAVRTSGEAPTTNGCSFDAHHALHSIMPEGDEFNALHIAAVTLLGSGAGAERPADKAIGALFVCEVEADCHSAVKEVDAAVGDSQRCLLHLDGRHLEGDKGALQAQLAAFLRDAPDGVVLLRRIDQMSPGLLPVLINAMSEQGAFQQDGEPVPTSAAMFLLTSLMPSEVFAYLNEEIKFRQEAKTHMVVDFALRSADKEEAKSQANALRRRIDLVIPIGSDPDWSEHHDGVQIEEHDGNVADEA
ncbi:N-acetylneuraminate epimerase [Micractinium conductrix]|uniref:N-acetylneuraminate epimerase n=1 Tax=Micractinium conductrix TaxID=554055 RepID=A0A2P6V953_9CHLO|nr:N-acetylneuraminate epimerase [Micractinium conductrix]|eukprot:PSC70620.1 N-acetylneuraminate epimerase [Micractinium conductrix]